MSNAWETTIEDVQNVTLMSSAFPVNEDVAKNVLTQLDLAAIEKAALRGNDMEKQTEYAYEEIATQLAKIQDRKEKQRAKEIQILELLGYEVVDMTPKMRKALKKGKVICPHDTEDVKLVDIGFLERDILHDQCKKDYIMHRSHYETDDESSPVSFYSCSCFPPVAWLLPADGTIIEMDYC